MSFIRLRYKMSIEGHVRGYPHVRSHDGTLTFVLSPLQGWIPQWVGEQGMPDAILDAFSDITAHIETLKHSTE